MVRSLFYVASLVCLGKAALIVDNHSEGQGVPNVRCPVYTYFEDLSLENHSISSKMSKFDHNRLLHLWLRNWYANGWEPVVLSRADAEATPLFANYKKKFLALPTVNNKDYELACYIRWLAFAERDGGVFVDYDIYNYPAELLPKAAGPCGKGPLLSYPDFLPMLLFGNGTETKRLILEYVRYQIDPETDRIDGRPHISDMIIARKRREHIFKDLLPNPRFLAHFSTHAKGKASSRLESAKKLRRPEWVRQNLILRYKQSHRILLLRPDPDSGDMIDAGIGKGGLLNDLVTECMPAVTAQDFLIEEFQMHEGDEYICKFQTVAQIESLMLSKKTDTILLMLENPIERLLRTYKRLGETFKEPPSLEELLKLEGRDYLVKQLTGRYNQTVAIEDMPGLLEEAKKIVGTGQVILGMPSRILDTKMVLEYNLGFILTPPTIPFTSPSEKMQKQIPEKIAKEFQSLNQFDFILYEYAKGVFEERLKTVKKIESQLSSE